MFDLNCSMLRVRAFTLGFIARVGGSLKCLLPKKDLLRGREDGGAWGWGAVLVGTGFVKEGRVVATHLVWFLGLRRVVLLWRRRRSRADKSRPR